MREYADTFQPAAPPIASAADYGMKADGTTDNTAALTAALSALQSTGGVLELSAGTYRINSQITLPNDGGAAGVNAKQKPIHLCGAGATFSGRGLGANGGTILDLRYSGATGKILTLGTGLLEISGITFTDLGGSSTPFIYTTNTTLHIHGAAFIGTKLGTNCDQDCIILGGTTEVYGQGNLNDGFQGYGTVIRDNYFDKIRRAVWFKTSANSVVVKDNTIWANSGSNLAGGAAIELLGSPPSGYAMANVVEGNLIEVPNYPYGIKANYAVNNSFIANGFWDDTATSLAAFRFENDAAYNLVIEGFRAAALPLMSDVPATNSALTALQGQASVWPKMNPAAKEYHITNPSTTYDDLTLFTGKLRVYDTTPVTGITSVYIRAAAGQPGTNLLTLTDNAEGWLAYFSPTGALSIPDVFSTASQWMIAGGNFYLASNKQFNFTSNTSMWDAVDVALKRNAAGRLEVNNGTGGQYADLKVRVLSLANGTEPTADVNSRFQIVAVAGGAGVKDTIRICAKDATDTYAWRTIY